MAAAWVGRAATPHTGKMFAKGARAGRLEGKNKQTSLLANGRSDRAEH